MKATIPKANVAKATVQQVEIGEVKIGTVDIARLVLNAVHIDSSTGLAQMRNTRLDLTLRFALSWQIGIVISMPDGIPDLDFSRSGTLDLGRLDLGLTLGNITLPGLSRLTFDIPSLPVTNLQAVIGAIRNLDLGPIAAERIAAAGIAAPVPGFQISGFGLSSVRADGLTAPAASIEESTIARVTGGAIPLPNLRIPGVNLPRAIIPSVTSQNVDARTNPVVASLTAEAGILATTLRVTTTARLRVDEFRLDNIQAAASIGEIVLSNVVLPYEVLNLTLSQIGLQSIEIPQLTVS